MRIELKSLFAAALAVALLAGCGKRDEEGAAAPAAQQAPAESPQASDAPGTTTTFGEPTPEPQQTPAE